MMAESMIVYFGTATSGEVAAWLDRHLSGSNGSWCFPSTGDYLVLVYEFEHCQSEIEPDEFARLCRLLGGQPASVFCLELRRSKGQPSHTAAITLAIDLLAHFAGVVENISGERYWPLADLRAGMDEII